MMRIVIAKVPRVTRRGEERLIHRQSRNAEMPSKRVMAPCKT